MVALDTNLVVRLIVKDHAGQLAAAIALLKAGPVFIPTTVVLESEWVLRFTYKLDRARIESSLQGLILLEGVTFEDPSVVQLALDYFKMGLDFADAFHLASSQHPQTLATFDRQFCHRAQGISSCKVFTPPASN